MFIKILYHFSAGVDTITYLDLTYNNISTVGIQELAEAFKFNNSITHLILRTNNIDNISAKLIAEAIRFNNSITRLDLSNNHISDIGVKPIAEVLKFNNSITRFDLRHNDIGEIGAKLIAEAIRFNNSITHLDLSWNKIDETGIKELSEALKFNNSITYLNLYIYRNDTGIEEIKLINSYLDRNKNLAKKTGRTLDAKDRNFYHQEKYKAEVTSIKKSFTEQKVQTFLENDNIKDDINVLGGDSTFIPATG
ncbi:MAG: hypothetical protein LN546_05670 [Rickettsia endosymbiont of Ecitomorpha arachnoides]|nr:hypothetical protein [Rickettsia endosymbiont of Ecitomorpha arachnoides]